MIRNNIILVGFSYTGKSSVGALVAQRLGWRFTDIDRRVEGISGKTVPEIFAGPGGEDQFRALERQALALACAVGESVIAAGGGAVLEGGNRMVMSGSGIVVLLEAKTLTIYQRILNDTTMEKRPLLEGDDPLANIKRLKGMRQPIYSEVADWTVHTDNLTIDEIADEVVRAWGRLGYSLKREVDQDIESLTQEDAGPHSAARLRVSGGAAAVVASQSGACPIFVLQNGIAQLGRRMKANGLSGTVYLVTDDIVHSLYGHEVAESLADDGFDVKTYAIDHGEASKNLGTAAKVYEWMAGHRAERNSVVVAFGGGVVGDLAGFVAASYARGVPFVQVPTTLLAMVDASIGGKVAVNLPQGKNMVGAFYQPRLVVADVNSLRTLPKRVLTEGWAEVIKHALILDAELLGLMEERADALLSIEPKTTASLIGRSAAIKAAVVSQDEREKGIRTLLNYGHTVGHALEAVTGYEGYLHGEAVSIGMMAAAHISKGMGLIDKSVVDRQRTMLEKFGLPIKASRIGIDEVMNAMSLDKKVRDKSIRWVLLEEIGRAVIRDDVPASLVTAVLREIFS
ncbi:MAG: 3-dehydroquinate synthase [Dehalococcoidia bacterium]|nr:3-dehydroquinate synthase [Dehalococcoidia bacterium]